MIQEQSTPLFGDIQKLLSPGSQDLERLKAINSRKNSLMQLLLRNQQSQMNPGLNAPANGVAFNSGGFSGSIDIGKLIQSIAQYQGAGQRGVVPESSLTPDERSRLA